MGGVERGIWWGTLRERGQMEYVGVYENNIKMHLQKVGFRDMDSVYLAQDRGRWRAVLKVLKILRDP
jgi:hypothetical protein